MAEPVCTCHVGPRTTRFDAGCPYHGDDGTMVATVHLSGDDALEGVFSRPECIFNYCPDPAACARACASPAESALDESLSPGKDDA